MEQYVLFPSVMKDMFTLQKEQESIQRVWMFNLDRVLITLHARKVTELPLVEVLAKFIAKDEPVTFITGKSPDQADLHILSPLAHLVKDKRLLQRVMHVGEKGGAWVNYSIDGELKMSYDSRFSMPLLFRERVSNIVQFPDVADLLEIEQKKTMLTLVMREGASFEAFQQIQGHIVWWLQQCLNCHDLASLFHVDGNGNCVEGEQLTGKGLGAQRIVFWFHTQHITPACMIACGDSICDLAMTEELSHHLPVEFIFVGSSDLVDADDVFSMTRPHARYEQGTLEYLSHIVPSPHAQKESSYA